jgi:hypothetical protein
MYTVQIERECGCFRKSEYKKEKSFDNQKDAYHYSKVLEELMNEEFCTKHLFIAQRVGDYDFVIRVADNPNAGGSCSTGSCGTSCGC